jgi:hypothetical protein
MRDHLKVTKVPSRQSVSKLERSDADQQIREGDYVSAPFRLGVDFRSSLGHLLGEWLDGDCCENGVQVISTLPRQFCSLGAMQTMLQFDHRDRR